MNSSKVQRVLVAFEKTGKIEQQTSNKNRLITILKWNEYQFVEQQLNNNRTTTEQQLNTNKNNKNNKNERNSFSQINKEKFYLIDNNEDYNNVYEN